MTDEEVLPEKGVLEKAATIKRFEYLNICYLEVSWKGKLAFGCKYEFDKKEDDETINKDEKTIT